MDKLIKLVVVAVVVALIIVACIVFRKPIWKTLKRAYSWCNKKTSKVQGKVKDVAKAVVAKVDARVSHV